MTSSASLRNLDEHLRWRYRHGEHQMRRITPPHRAQRHPHRRASSNAVIDDDCRAPSDFRLVAGLRNMSGAAAQSPQADAPSLPAHSFPVYPKRWPDPVATENRIRAGADAAMGYPRFGMLDLLKLLGGLLVGLFRSHAAREAKQHFSASVLKRSAPARLRLRTADRIIFVWLYRLFPSVREAAVV